jgi:hypothetical protein
VQGGLRATAAVSRPVWQAKAEEWPARTSVRRAFRPTDTGSKGASCNEGVRSGDSGRDARAGPVLRRRALLQAGRRGPSLPDSVQRPLRPRDPMSPLLGAGEPPPAAARQGTGCPEHWPTRDW